MRIDSVAFKHHKVLGDTQIVLYGEKPSIKKEGSYRLYDDMIVFWSQTKENTYTYIIGENGAGKSVFFRSLINYSNSFCKNDNLHELFKLSSLTNKNSEIANRAFNELFFDYNIWNFKGCEGFLEINDSFLIHISSAINEKEISSESIRYIDINYSERNQTNIMITNAFRKNDSQKISSLSEMIGKKDAKWTCDIEIANSNCNNNEITLNIKEGKTLQDIIALFDKLSKSDFNTSELNNEELVLLNLFLSTKSIHDYFYYEKHDVKTTLKNIRGSLLFQQIIDFFSSLHPFGILSTKYGSTVGVTFQSPKEIDSFLKHNIDLKIIPDIDFLLLRSLIELDFLKCEIVCDNVPVDRFSSGEQMLVRLFSIFANIPTNFNKSKIILLYDEPENSLHPKWQQHFCEYFKYIAEKIYGIESSHFIFSTHSPLLIMGAAAQDNTNVVKFYKDQENRTMTQQINNVHRFSIEELFMDEFSMSYRTDEEERHITELLNKENQRRSLDRASCIEDYDALRNEIDVLYEKIQFK